MSSTKMDCIDNLDRVLVQAEAMVGIIHGNGFEGFRAWSDKTQDNYLWAVCDKIREAKKFAGQLMRHD